MRVLPKPRLADSTSRKRATCLQLREADDSQFTLTPVITMYPSFQRAKAEVREVAMKSLWNRFLPSDFVTAVAILRVTIYRADPFWR